MNSDHTVDAQLSALAAHLKARRETILRAWRKAVDRDPEMNTGASLPRAQLDDHIPALLDAFGRMLPLSLKEGLSKRFGTRHRAAIGVTEETDALAIVVSEERGTISLARDGQLIEDLDGKSLRDLLYREYATQA